MIDCNIYAARKWCRLNDDVDFDEWYIRFHRDCPHKTYGEWREYIKELLKESA